MSEKQGILQRLEHYADCIEKGVHVTGSQLKRLVLDIREQGGVDDAKIAQLEKANEQLHAHGERMHAEIEALRAEVNTAKGQAEFYRTERNKNQRKAERLAEAGRRVTSAFRAHGEAHPFTRENERTRHECEAALIALDAALRDHDQEVG